jgi:hypothetical protein
VEESRTLFARLVAEIVSVAWRSLWSPVFAIPASCIATSIRFSLIPVAAPAPRTEQIVIGAAADAFTNDTWTRSWAVHTTAITFRLAVAFCAGNAVPHACGRCGRGRRARTRSWHAGIRVESCRSCSCARIRPHGRFCFSGCAVPPFRVDIPSKSLGGWRRTSCRADSPIHDESAFNAFGVRG